jgi:hypothetical protein
LALGGGQVEWAARFVFKVLEELERSPNERAPASKTE